MKVHSVASYVNALERGYFLVHMSAVFVVNDTDARPYFLPRNWGLVDTKD